MAPSVETTDSIVGTIATSAPLVDSDGHVTPARWDSVG